MILYVLLLLLVNSYFLLVISMFLQLLLPISNSFNLTIPLLQSVIFIATLTSGMSYSTLQAMWYGGKGMDQFPLVQLRLTDPEVKGQEIKKVNTAMMR